MDEQTDRQTAGQTEFRNYYIDYLPSLWLISFAPYVKGFLFAPGFKELNENKDFATGGGSFWPNFPFLYCSLALFLAAFLWAILVASVNLFGGSLLISESDAFWSLKDDPEIEYFVVLWGYKVIVY